LLLLLLLLMAMAHMGSFAPGVWLCLLWLAARQVS